MQQIGPNTWASPSAAATLSPTTISSSSSTAALPPRDTSTGSTGSRLDSSSSPSTPSAGGAHHNNPSSLPPWVHVDRSSSNGDESTPFLGPSAPSATRPNTRHYRPPPSHHFRHGRKWDQYRTAEPALLGAPIAERQLEWAPFMRSGPQPVEFRAASAAAARGKGTGAGGRYVDRAWLEANVPTVMQGWKEEDDADPEHEGKAPGGFRGVMYKGKWLISPERQERTVRLFWRLLLKNAFVPLVFRITVLAFSTAALGIGTTIYENVRRVNYDNDPDNQCDPRASTYMAIVVGAITIPYVGYVTWDEYTSKPLGLRSVAAKTLLLLCDLYFIVFSASNVSLAFDALLDHSWACYPEGTELIGDIRQSTPQTCPNNPSICYKQRTLSGVLIVSLLAWLLCFSISVLRVVEKLRPE